MKKNIVNIIIILIAIISLISIPFNFIRWLKDIHYLRVTKNNFDIINSLFENGETLPKTAEKIGYMHGLGDWYLIIKYKSGFKEEKIYGDGSNLKLRGYIAQNGYNEGEIAKNELILAPMIILLSIIYGISNLNNKKSSNIK